MICLVHWLSDPRFKSSKYLFTYGGQAWEWYQFWRYWRSERPYIFIASHVAAIIFSVYITWVGIAAGYNVVLLFLVLFFFFLIPNSLLNTLDQMFSTDCLVKNSWSLLEIPMSIKTSRRKLCSWLEKRWNTPDRQTSENRAGATLREIIVQSPSCIYFIEKQTHYKK